LREPAHWRASRRQSGNQYKHDETLKSDHPSP
jgi:hypothetical protein